MKIITLDQVTFSEIVDCFNLAFSDYFVKFNATESYLQKRWHGAGVDLSMSAGVQVDGKLVGFIASGIGAWEGLKTTYNAGTGVVPQHRGKGYTSQMYDFLKPKYQAAGIQCCTLEVIQENAKAIHLYEKAGLKIHRKLNCYGGEVRIEESDVRKDLEFKKMETPDWDAFHSFHDFQPAWENNAAAILKNLTDYVCYGVFQKEELVAYAYIKPAVGYVSQFGVHPKFRRQGIGKFLFFELSKMYPIQKINNVNAGTAHVSAFLLKIGLKNSINQYEMVSYL